MGTMWGPGHPGPAPPVKNEDTRTTTWTRTGWFSSDESTMPALEHMEAYVVKSGWQGNVSTSAPFSNPITRMMASFYQTSEEKNKEMCKHIEHVEEGCQRIMMYRLAQNPRDDKFFEKGRALPATFIARQEVEKKVPLRGGLDDHVAQYSR
jgi:hypothetical protein